MSNIIIGIAGGSASGKSTFAHELEKMFANQDVLFLKMDDWYKDQSDLTLEQRKETNYDHPNAFDMEMLINNLKELRSGSSIQKPMYDFVVSTRSGYEQVESKKIIIIEGVLLFQNPEIRDLLDIKVYVDASSDIRVIRRMKRDTEERGRSIDHIIDQYLTTVRPMHMQFIEPTKSFADIIIPSNKDFSIGLDLIANKIKHLL